MAIVLSIIAGCEDVPPFSKGEQGRFTVINHIEEKNNRTDVYSDSFSSITKNSGENKSTTNYKKNFPKLVSVNQDIVSEKQIKTNKPSSRRGLPLANYHFDKLRLLQSEYQVIAENNLFRPLGWKKEVLTETTPKTENTVIEIRRERPAPTYNLTLTGIAQSGSKWIAIVEDETEKEGYFLNRDEKLKDALVSEILEERIILVIGGEKVQFPLGASIQYDRNEHIIPNTITNQNPTLERSEGALPSIPKSEIRIPNSGEDTQSLIEQMKARRRKELGQE
jgi:hypothetical protein